LTGQLTKAYFQSCALYPAVIYAALKLIFERNCQFLCYC